MSLPLAERTESSPKKVGEGPSFPDSKLTGSSLKVLNTADNLKALLDFLSFKPYLNTMTYEVEIEASTETGIRVIPRDELNSILISESSKHGFPRDGIEHHLHIIAKKNKRHPVAMFLEGKLWDRVERVDAVIDCVVSKQPELTKLIMRRWFVGCIASLYEDNFKSKLVPVLQGDQSRIKTAYISRFAEIVEHAFLEGAELNPTKKDSIISSIYSWIIELGELERTTKHSQGALKAFVSKKVDTVRPPYCRVDIKKPRQSHFIATVNGEDFLKDRTGNTRFAVIELTAPVEIERVNSLLGWSFKRSGSTSCDHPEKLLQFWLEVKCMYDEGEPWMFSPEEQRRVDRLSNRYLDKGHFYKLIAEYLHTSSDYSTCNEEWLTSTQICGELGVQTTNVVHIGRALKMLADDELLDSRHKNGYRLYQFPTNS
ncbi:VapE domain-containing protein [Vibrio tapetis]|uniref:Virulence-associated protein E-like domain-containing protein n=1 Tax=Vibrio tapetis subsp. tapetis TaxID=1671868 RepID=A0A2N8Z8C9_9VIBR|nr:VapE domain-containing protein [Vibrio tapetis]SON48157.1 conserved protein of unknown function [Vibrio tapetis subsp. tapetis]